MAKMNGPCLLWNRALSSGGYGVFRGSDGKNKYAHRAAYEERFGTIPKGMFVCHRCDVRSCVNPDHLFIGTAKDNNRDMMKKGRARFTGPTKDIGTSPYHTSKVSELTVQRLRIVAGVIGQRELSRVTNINRATIGAIMRRDSWARLGQSQALT